jgi:hypothetical protein
MTPLGRVLNHSPFRRYRESTALDRPLLRLCGHDDLAGRQPIPPLLSRRPRGNRAALVVRNNSTGAALLYCSPKILQSTGW